jgi:hypothetical protein
MGRHTGDGLTTFDNSKRLRLGNLGFVKLHMRRAERVGCHIRLGLSKNVALSSPSPSDLRLGDCPMNVLYPLGELEMLLRLSRSHHESANICDDARSDRFCFLR